jgi:hypothetical protein
LKPLLKQVVSDILDPAKPDLVDVENRSSGLKNLLKSGFGYGFLILVILAICITRETFLRLFGATIKPRPSDHSLLIIFVLGGVTPTEVKQIKDVAAKHDSHQVYFMHKNIQLTIKTFSSGNCWRHRCASTQRCSGKDYEALESAFL